MAKRKPERRGMLAAALAVAAMATVAGCGGGGSASGSDSEGTPASATAAASAPKATGNQTPVVLTGPAKCNGVTASTDGSLVASICEAKVVVWDTATQKITATLVGKWDGVGALAFSPDGKTLAVGALRESESQVQLWDVSTGQKTAELDPAEFGTGGVTTGLGFSADGSTLATYGQNGIVLRDMATGKVTKSKVRSSETIVLSPDGKTVATSAGLFNVATGAKVASYAGAATSALVLGVAFTPDGKTVAAGALGTNVSLVDVATGQITATLTRKVAASLAPDDRDAVVVLGITQDGKTLVTFSPGMVNFWDVATQEVVDTVKIVAVESYRVTAISANGKLLAATDSDGAVRLWNR